MEEVEVDDLYDICYDQRFLWEDGDCKEDVVWQRVEGVEYYRELEEEEQGENRDILTAGTKGVGC